MKSASRLKLAATALTVARAVTRPGAPTLLTRVQCVPRLTLATLNGSYTGTTPARLGLLAAAAAYVASPVDLVPEAVLPLIGLTDDVLVLRWAVGALVEETDRFLGWEAARQAWVPVAPSATRPASEAGVPGASTASRRMPRLTRSASADEPFSSTPLASEDRPGSRAVVRDAAAGYVLERVRRRLER